MTSSLDDTEYSQQIVDFKNLMRSRRDTLVRAYGELDDELQRQAEQIQRESAAGHSVLPELSYQALRDGTVNAATCDAIRRRGALIVRGVFSHDQAERWNQQLGEYIDDNDFYRKAAAKSDLDRYFSELSAGRPQIFGLYWSKPQVMIRQAESMAITKRFLNRLWRHDSAAPEFDPDRDYTYADRARRREPGDATLGLSPHMDAGSIERWLDPAFQKIYAPVLAGHWRDFDPFLASHRTATQEIPSPAVCSMFRSFQGWTALTEQGPNDGTLQLAPIANGIAYLLLRALQPDVADDDLCGAQPGRALGADPAWHASLLASLISIPQVAPGDTVWWHPDLIHAVGNEHHGAGYANVIYVGASPRCAKNRAYVAGQAKAFLSGCSAPDFAAEDYEVDFRHRATLDDLSELGRAQMGL